jgi:nitric oxide dioxygenase
MTESDIALVEASRARIAPVRALVGELFHARLLMLAPELETDTPGDTGADGDRLMDWLASFVCALRDGADPAADDNDRPASQARHDPGVVREALLWTLARGIGEDFSPDAARAWNAAVARLDAADLPVAARRAAHGVGL